MRHSRFALSSRALATLVGVLGMTLATAGLQSPAVATEPSAPAQAAPAADDSTRPDAVSAMVTARVSGDRVEDLSQRDEFTRVYANPDGTWTGETAPEPEQIQDAQGSWHEVDDSLVERDGGLSPAYAASDLVISDGGDKTFASMTENGKRLDWRWPSALPTPSVDGPTATYPNALPGVGDLVVTATSTGFTHNIVLRRAPSRRLEVTLPIATHGAALVENKSGSVAVESASGATLVAAPQPLMWDSSSDVGGQPEVATVDTAVGKTAAGTPTLTLTPDDAFLSDAATVYPVTIDPSYSNSQNTTGDTWVQNADYTSSQVSSDMLRAGTYDGGGHKARSFMHFDTTKWNGKHILSASLVLRNWYSGSCTGAAIRAARITDAWTAADVTWGNQPGAGALYYDDYNPAHGYSSSCAGDDATFNVKDMVQDWASGGFTNNGIRLKAVDETSIYTWRKYRSANYGGSVQPHINYTYNSYPNKPGTPSVSTSPASSAGYSTSTTPTFKATVSDPDGGTARAKFEVYQGSTLKWSGYSSYVSSGGTASLTSGALSNGTTYTVKALANDGTDSSKSYSSVTTFTVDTSKPTVAVTASAFTDGQWTTDVPAANTFTFNGPSDTKSFAYTLDGVAQPAKTADANGDATVSWLPKSGSHKITATPTDKAGNSGTATTFSFGVGPASFNTPAASTRSTGVFPVEVSGPPNATGATLSWRYAGQTAWNPVEGTTRGGSPWAGGVSTTGDGTASSSGALLWDATAQEDPASSADPKANLNAPALIELKTCFTYTGTPSQVCSSAPRQVQLVPSAFGGNFPVTEVGPAMVALFTGEATLTETEAVDTAAGVGRTFSAFDASTATSGAFGPGWATSLIAPGDAGAELLDHRAKDRTMVLLTAGGSSQMFTPLDPNVDPVNPAGSVEFRPAGADDGSRLVLEGTTVTLTRLEASITTWQATDGEWVLQEATAGEASSEEPETRFEFDAPGYPTWIAQSEPGTATTCTETVQEAGCRGLKVSYSGAGTARRVTQIDRVAAGAPTTRLATYSYTTEGLLDTVCGGDPDDQGSLQPLCARYTYDTTSVDGRTLLKQVTPPGQKPWQFTYDSTGRLTKVTRTLDENTNAGTSPATWTVAYDLDPGAAGLPDLSASAVAEWGQATVPTKAFAVFSPTHVPAATVTSTDLEYANLWYSDVDGTTTNTAVHGNVDGAAQWLVDTSWYDDYGNTIRTLDGAGRLRALTADPATREAVASEASAFTSYNDDGDDDHTDGDGTRIEDEFGAVHTATLKDGTTDFYRTHTAYVYDDDAPTLGGGSKPAYGAGRQTFNLVVETRHSAADPAMVRDYDTTIARNEYDPVVVGDGSGWTLGSPTRIKVQLEDGSWSTSITRYDDRGRQVETRQPGGGVATDGSGSDAHATTFSYYAPSAADPDCAMSGHPDRSNWAGLLCKTGPAGQPSGPSMPVTYNAAFNDDLQPTRVEETSGNTTRVTTVSYDRIGRPTGATIGVGNDTMTTAISYDAALGLPTTQSGEGGDISTAYDSWGRERRYTDATGLTSTLTFTDDGLVASSGDGVDTTAYSYDGSSGEHRRLPTSVSVGLGATSGAFTYAYDEFGAPTAVTYPNGTVANLGYDSTGNRTSLNYADALGQELISFNASPDVDGRVIANASTASEQRYSHDALGRLTSVEDTRQDQCTTRTYGFSDSSERTRSTSFASGADGACQTAVPEVARTYTYDDANRIRTSGYTYDNLGRTLTIPVADTVAGGASELTATYFPNNMVKSLSQAVADGVGGTIQRNSSYALDAAGRIQSITENQAGTEKSRAQYRFSDQSDAPSSIRTSTDQGASWSTTRYVNVPVLGMAVSVADGVATYHLANLHGDLVSSQDSTTGGGIASYSETDEFGNAIVAPAPGRYGWLGAKQRSADNLGGFVTMGARLYNPATGAFTTPDAVLGGNLTRYAYPSDPCNEVDLTGFACDGKEWWRDWASYFAGSMHWGSWTQTYDQSGPTGWLRDQLEEIYGLSPVRLKIKDKNVRYGYRIFLQRRCGKQSNGRLGWDYRIARANYGQYRWKVGVVFGWFSLPGGVWVNGKVSVWWTYV